MPTMEARARLALVDTPPRQLAKLHAAVTTVAHLRACPRQAQLLQVVLMLASSSGVNLTLMI